MRNLKKFLALVLSMMMVLSLFVTASATSITKDGKSQEFKDTANAEFTTAIEVLNGMEVLKGDANPATGEPTGNFRPADQITRAEVAALVFRLATGQTGTTDADHYARYGNFSDVDKSAWYAGYVGYCANAGYIKGYDPFEGGRFGPSDPVTGYQALAMILRAMGYGVNGEFEGSNWQLAVAAVGTQTHILDNINNSHFNNNTLYNPAPREVVAEIYFQAAMTPCVVYTPAYGYQTTDVRDGIANGITDNGLPAGTSLGWVNFGLTRTTRIVLGNQDTGESNTVLGSPVVSDSKDVKSPDGHPYAYPGSVVEWSDDAPAKALATADNGLTLKVDTDLLWFGHKVTAYYDGRGTSNRRTYAIYDLAKWNYAYTTDGYVRGKLADAAEKYGFNVDEGYGFHISDRFGYISSGKSVYAATFQPIVDETSYPNEIYKLNADKEPVTPLTVGNNIREDNVTNNNDDLSTLPYGSEAAGGTQRYIDTTDSGRTLMNEVGNYYMLISNGGDNLDVVITLAPELERVTEHNTTASVKTVRLSGVSDGTLAASYGGDRNDSTFGMYDDGIVRMDSLTNGARTQSDKTLGNLVVGWEIKGTNYDTTYDDEIIKGNGNEYKYWLQKIDNTITGTVKYYNGSTGEVVLDTANGEKTLAWTRLPVVNYASSPAQQDRHEDPTHPYLYTGVQYTFKLDPTDSTRYVDWSQGFDYQFLYATYADYEVGGLGTGDLSYYVTGVNWAGEKVINQPVSTVNKARLSGFDYENLLIAKKNLGSANWGGIVGNEIQTGLYTGYGYNAGTKDLDTVDAGRGTGNSGDGSLNNWDDANLTGYAGYAYTTNNRYWNDKIHVDYAGTPGDYVKTSTAGKWHIDQGNVADGWADQQTNNRIGSLLLTPSTKFIVVSGTGTSTLNVDIYNGIKEFLGTSSEVTIDVKRFNAAGNALPEYNAYYKLADVTFNNWYKDFANLPNYSDDNYVVDTVILPKDAVTWSDNTNVWFTNRAGYNNVYLADVDAHRGIEQLTMWRDGVEQRVFIDTTVADSSLNDSNPAVAPIVDDVTYGMFYKLTKLYEINGTPIYRADRMTSVAMDNVYGTGNSATVCDLDLTYNYTAVNNVTTARLTQRDVWGDYNLIVGGSVKSNVYNVTGATVKDVSGSKLNIKDIQTLNEAVSIGYDITVAIVNDGHYVKTIYVTSVDGSVGGNDTMVH